MFSLPREPQSIGKVLDTAFRLLRSAYSRALPLSLLYAVLLQLPSLIAPDMGSAGGAAGPAPISPALLPVVLVAIVLGIAFYAAMTYSMDRVAHGEPVGFGEAVGKGMRKLLPVIGLAILYMLAVGVGMVLLIIPGIILMLNLALGFGLLVLEDRGPIDALRHSNTLVWGNWWRTLAELAIIGLLYMIPMILVMVVVGGVVGATGAFQSGAGAFAINLANVVVVALLTPLMMAGYLAVLYDRRLRKEGGDLEARLSSAA